MNWDDLRYALAVAEAGSLSMAASEMGVNASTVLRRIAALEQATGVSSHTGRAGCWQYLLQRRKGAGDLACRIVQCHQ